MRIHTSDKFIAWSTLLSGLTVSAVAIYYSVAGLMAIFSAAVIPIIVMGVALEISKLAGTVWLKQNWGRAPYFIRAYLLAAIAILMLITSMGIFGFLSKAHSDQSLVSGDVQSKIAIYDEKIKTSKDNIDANRKALKQMDEAVDQVMGRSSDEKGADKAVAIRRGQAKERTRLQSEIAAEQKTIGTLNEQAAPIRAEVRKVEAEVGPIKYIAAFIYGDNPDANVLEKAVTWVIIIIVIVFDPLAVILLLASQYSFQWFRRQEEEAAAIIPENISEPEDHKVPSSAVTQEELDALLKEEEPPKFEHASVHWPFPAVHATNTDNPIDFPKQEEEFKFLADDKDVYPEETKDALEDWNKMIAEAEKAVEAEKVKPVEEHEEDDLDDLDESEKVAIKHWKADHPGLTVKHQRKMLEENLITELPWEQYLKAKADFTEDEAAEEAAKWAQEQLDLKKKEVTWMERVGNQQIKKTKE
jgi:hypothetical protein